MANRYKMNENGTRYRRIWDWKHKLGIKFADTTEEDYWYARYLDATHCEICGTALTENGRGKHFRVLDHDHRTGAPRYVCCNECNKAVGYLERHLGRFIFDHHTTIIAQYVANCQDPEKPTDGLDTPG